MAHSGKSILKKNILKVQMALSFLFILTRNRWIKANVSAESSTFTINTKQTWITMDLNWNNWAFMKVQKVRFYTIHVTKTIGRLWWLKWFIGFWVWKINDTINLLCLFYLCAFKTKFMTKRTDCYIMNRGRNGWSSFMLFLVL